MTPNFTYSFVAGQSWIKIVGTIMLGRPSLRRQATKIISSNVPQSIGFFSPKPSKKRSRWSSKLSKCFARPSSHCLGAPSIYQTPIDLWLMISLLRFTFRLQIIWLQGMVMLQNSIGHVEASYVSWPSFANLELLDTYSQSCRRGINFCSAQLPNYSQFSSINRYEGA